MFAEEMAINKKAVDEMPVDKMTKMIVNKMTVDEMPEDKMTQNKC